MRRSIWKSLLSLSVALFAVIPLLAFAGAGTACAGMAGPKILTAEGGVTDSNGDAGHMVMGGLVFLNNDGTAKALNLTIAYQDNPIAANAGIYDNFICLLTDPSDLTYSASNGVGTATVTFSATDECVSPFSGVGSPGDEAGRSISFKIYNLGSKVRMVSTGSTMADTPGDTLGNVAISGEMDPSSAGSRQAGGRRFVSGEGGAVDADDTYSGHMALAGLMQLAPVSKKVTTGTAKLLDLKLNFEDTDSNNLSCHFTDPADVSYTLSGGVGILTLTVSAQDTCSVTNTGNWIKFVLYAGGASGRLVSTVSTLVDGAGDQFAPAVVAMFSTAGGH